ncbi:hypothetical protein [Rhizobium leguminosarum]|uniref:hypothetical protein n=1 Tax=Rhizobium leguminosarum TaxID=384 RepID=UPI0013EE8C42|nr:hypothetical protein [Rhizobium leguminosarum]
MSIREYLYARQSIHFNDQASSHSALREHSCLHLLDLRYGKNCTFSICGRGDVDRGSAKVFGASNPVGLICFAVGPSVHERQHLVDEAIEF